LRQILINLVSNAIKFTFRGDITVEVDTAESLLVPPSGIRRPETDIVLRCVVRDTGIGIPVEKHSAVFNPFEQADGSTTREFGGTGLGLAISKQLVTLMNGQLSVDSTEGCGSAFHFTVPLCVAPAAAPSQHSSAELPPDARVRRSPEADVGNPAQSLRILLAEDNVVNQMLVVRLLEKRGHTVVVADNGREALAALQDGWFNIVLMDVQMPEMDGFEVTAKIRDGERVGGVHLPIIALTAHAMKGDQERCLAAGMDAYVSKPIQPARLFEAIGQLELAATTETALVNDDASSLRVKAA
jgi:CheY-like chemotaxis protein/anti-sigma regulatory factor (Ser/Thr protein kinase)